MNSYCKVMNNTIIRKDGYLYFENLDSYMLPKLTLIIEAPKLQEYRKYIEYHNISSIMINSNYTNGVIGDLSFLGESSLKIRSLTILQPNMNIGDIDSLVNLEVLSMEGSLKKDLDISIFKFLKYLNCVYSTRLRNLEIAFSLKHLSLSGFKMDDLSIMRNLKLLESVALYNTHIKYLYGIGNLINLKKVLIDKAPKLKNLCGFTEQNSNMETVEVFNAKNLRDIIALKYLHNLKTLYLQRISDIETLSFLSNISNLDRIVVSSNVDDKDYSFVETIPHRFILGYQHNNL